MTELTEYLQQKSGPSSTGPTAAPDSLTLTSDDLEQLWSELMPDSYRARRGLELFLDSVRTAADQAPDQADLQFRPGGWQVNLSRGAVQTIVATALLAGLLVVFGAAQIPAGVATAVVPLLFDVERIRLTPGQEYLLAELVAHREALDGSMTPRELYEKLPPDTRAQLPFLEFADFLGTCYGAGLADVAESGTVQLRPSDRARFRITLR